ncbi:MAG: NAD(P)H-hydrate epimerase, partial [Myxococcota bacterium]
MKPLWTIEEARRFDQLASEHGVPKLSLMENAGRGAADVIAARYPVAQRILVLAGPGQNGGDGYVVARFLSARGKKVAVMAFGREPTGDAAINRDAWQKLGGTVLDGSTPPRSADLRPYDLLVDALFGTGLDRPLEGALKELTASMRKAEVPTVALDVPSGISAERGRIGDAVRAELTVSFGAAKRGHYEAKAAELVGELEVAFLGADPFLFEPSALVLEADDLRVAPRSRVAHKGQSGRVCIVAGHANTAGAAALVARGA